MSQNTKLPFEWSLLASLTSTLSPTNLVTAFLGGSFAAGFANELSDIDIYAIVKKLPTPETKSEWRVMPGGRRIEFLYITMDELEDAIKRLNTNDLIFPEQQLPGQKFDPLNITYFESSFFHVILKGEPLAEPNSAFEIRSKVKLRHYAASQIIDAAWQIDRFSQDLHGNLRATDLDTAIFCSRKLTGHAFDMLLMANGETLPREKWRIRKGRRLLGESSKVFQQFRRLSNGPYADDQEELIAALTDALWFTQYCQAQCLISIDNMEQNIELGNPCTSTDIASAPDDNFVCHPQLILTLYGNGKYILSTPDGKGVQLGNNILLYCWLSAATYGSPFSLSRLTSAVNTHLKLPKERQDDIINTIDLFVSKEIFISPLNVSISH